MDLLDKQGLDYIAFTAWVLRNRNIKIRTLSSTELKPYVRAYKQMREIRNTHLISDFKFCSVCKKKRNKKHFYRDPKGLRCECKDCTKQSDDKFEKKYGVKRNNLMRHLSLWHDVKLGTLDHEERLLYAIKYKKHLGKI